MPKYDILLFDADETLLDFARAEHVAITETLNKFGILADEATVSTYSRINLGLWKRLERKEIDKTTLRTERFRLFCADIGSDADFTAMARFYENSLSRQAFLIDGAAELCKRLSEKCRIYIITNGIKFIQTSRMARSGLLPYIKESFISEDVGYEKPDLRYFDTVMAAIDGFDKKRAVVIGDSLTSDMKGGINAGIDTCWYNPRGLATDLPVTYSVSSFDEIEKIILCEEYDA